MSRAQNEVEQQSQGGSICSTAVVSNNKKNEERGRATAREDRLLNVDGNYQDYHKSSKNTKREDQNDLLRRRCKRSLLFFCFPISRGGGRRGRGEDDAHEAHTACSTYSACTKHTTHSVHTRMQHTQRMQHIQNV